jgi:hypothetical protein
VWGCERVQTVRMNRLRFFVFHFEVTVSIVVFRRLPTLKAPKRAYITHSKFKTEISKISTLNF